MVQVATEEGGVAQTMAGSLGYDDKKKKEQLGKPLFF